MLLCMFFSAINQLNSTLFQGSPVLAFFDSSLSINTDLITQGSQPVSVVNVNPEPEYTMAQVAVIDTNYSHQHNVVVVSSAQPLTKQTGAMDQADYSVVNPVAAAYTPPVAVKQVRSMTVIIPMDSQVGQILTIAAPDGSMVRVSTCYPSLR
jgi:hypothetical protein